MINKISEEAIQNQIKIIDNWFCSNSYYGYDIYDLYDNKLFNKLLSIRFTLLRKFFRKLIGSLVLSCPNTIIRIAHKKKNLNAKALGLILKSYCNLYSISNDKTYLDKARNIALILLKNFNSDYQGKSWGYPFNWSSKMFVPKNTPSSVVTCIIGDAFFSLFEITKEPQYLITCKDICHFLMYELNIDEIGNDKICFSYTPIDHNHVHNANLFVAEFLIRIGKQSNQNELVNLGMKALNYTVSEQNKDGSFYYWGDADKKHLKFTKSKFDHYHTGFELRSLKKINDLIKADELSQKLSNYYDYYISNYIDKKKEFIYLRPHKTYPINIHACAEFIIVNVHFSVFNRVKKELFLTIVKNVINRMLDKDGLFIYEINKLLFFTFKTKYKFLRWSQAWMFLALTEFLKYTKKDIYGNN